ncbi:MAG TPA: ABC transporter permease, partial [Ilumatobacteraceae bacterium]|nr:ABC transporter permease [Ilumatobacteraceae bacterium]
MRKIALAFVQMVIVSFLVFLLLSASPGDPAQELAGEFATADQVAKVRTELGLDRPVFVQYADWASDAVRGDLGRS